MIDAPKNKFRAPLKPLNFQTLALSTLGLGFVRPAPGSWGSLPPPLLAGILFITGAATPAVHYTVFAAVMLASSAACICFGRYAESRFGRKDPAEVVADETAGVSLALLIVNPDMLAAGNTLALLTFAGLAFFAFRFFDITKLWPARALEALPHGWGVLTDDLVAGVYAGLFALLISRQLL